MASEQPRRSRWRLLRFSLRTFLLLLTIACLMLGGYAKQVRDQTAATAIVKSWGGEVLFDYQWSSAASSASGPAKLAPRSKPVPPYFQKARKLLGDDYFSNVVAVSIPYHVTTDIDVNVLYGFRSLRALGLSGTHTNDADLKNVARLKKIEILQLADTDVTDEGMKWLIKMPRLANLSLRGTLLSDIGLAELAKQTTLQRLDIADTNVSKEGLRRFTAVLPNCEVIAGPFATQKPLKW